MLGLWARERTGRGQYLETSMLSSAAYVHSNDMVIGPEAPAWALPDRGQHGFGATYRLYRCRTGWLFLSAWRDRDFRSLARALGRDDWIERDDLGRAAGRWEAREELVAELSRTFGAHDSSHWLASLGLPESVLVAASGKPVEHWFEEHELFSAMDHPEFGPYWQPNSKVSFDGEMRAAAATCSLGEHAWRILGELGYAASEIALLQEQGVIRCG